MGTRAVIEFHHDKQQKEPDVRVFQKMDGVPDNVIPTLESIYALFESYPIATDGDEYYSTYVASLYICEQRHEVTKYDPGHPNATVVAAAAGKLRGLDYRYIVRLSLGQWFVDVLDGQTDEVIETAVVGQENSRMAEIHKRMELPFAAIAAARKKMN